MKVCHGRGCKTRPFPEPTPCAVKFQHCWALDRVGRCAPHSPEYCSPPSASSEEDRHGQTPSESEFRELGSPGSSLRDQKETAQKQLLRGSLCFLEHPEGKLIPLHLYLDTSLCFLTGVNSHVGSSCPSPSLFLPQKPQRITRQARGNLRDGVSERGGRRLGACVHQSPSHR